MTRSSRGLWISVACVAAVALVVGAAGAANKTRVDQATRRVDQGARQIGQGKVGPGFKEMFTGIGHTIVEGAKFSGATMDEFFKKSFGS
jgi:hypothetical protein